MNLFYSIFITQMVLQIWFEIGHSDNCSWLGIIRKKVCHQINWRFLRKRVPITFVFCWKFFSIITSVRKNLVHFLKTMSHIDAHSLKLQGGGGSRVFWTNSFEGVVEKSKGCPIFIVRPSFCQTLLIYPPSPPVCI